MIHEYALEPSLLNTWTAFRYLSEKFGYGRGRVISRYPKLWEKMVYDSLVDCRPVEKKRIEVGLVRLKSVLHSRFHEWSDAPWIENAVIEHQKRPFHAIIASENQNNHEHILREADLAEALAPRWRVEPQRRIVRTAVVMAESASLLVRSSKEIILVDPYFQPNQRRFSNPLARILSLIALRPSTIPLVRIEYHTGNTKAGVKAQFDLDCRTHLPKLFSARLNVRFVRWQQEHLHNRYILTERGGIKFGIGLDENGGNPPLEDTIDLLTEETHKAIWAEYQRSLPKFPLIEDDLIITGSARD